MSGRKSAGGWPAICLDCGAHIQTDAAALAFREGREWTCESCERVLVRASEAEQLDIFERAAANNAKATGQDRARQSDPDAFDAAVSAIRLTAHLRPEFTSDDVSLPGRGNEIGAAFAFLRKRGEIEFIGFDTSRRASRHAAVVRRWKATR